MAHVKFQSRAGSLVSTMELPEIFQDLYCLCLMRQKDGQEGEAKQVTVASCIILILVSQGCIQSVCIYSMIKMIND